MELFWKVSGQQGCQICTTGLPENINLGLIQQLNAFFLLLYFVGDRSKSRFMFMRQAQAQTSQRRWLPYSSGTHVFLLFLSQAEYMR